MQFLRELYSSDAGQEVLTTPSLPLSTTYLPTRFDMPENDTAAPCGNAQAISDIDPDENFAARKAEIMRRLFWSCTVEQRATMLDFATRLLVIVGGAR